MLFPDKAFTATAIRRRFDAAIITSILAIGVLNLVVMADQIRPAKAYAAVPCRCGSLTSVALA